MTREELSQRWRDELSNMADQFGEQVESVVKAQLDAWARRYPRHTFGAWDSMGMFCITVSPPVLGHEFPDHIGGYEGARFAALNDLCTEVRALVDWYGTFDTRASICISEQSSATVHIGIKS